MKYYYKRIIAIGLYASTTFSMEENSDECGYKVGLALIGMGKQMEKSLIPAVDKDKYDLVYGCRQNRPALETQQKIYGIYQITTDYVEILSSKDVQAIMVAGDPEKLHVPVVKAALESERHIFVEKPLSLSFETVKELAKLSQDKKIVIMVGFNMTHTPTADYLQKEFSQNRLNELLITCSLGVPQGKESFLESFNNSYYYSFIHAASFLSKVTGMPKDIQVNFTKTEECPNSYSFSAICENANCQKITLSFSSGITPAGFNLGVQYNDSEGTTKFLNLTDKNNKDNEKTHSYKRQMDTFFDCIKNGTQPDNNLQKNVEIHEIMENIKTKIFSDNDQLFETSEKK